MPGDNLPLALDSVVALLRRKHRGAFGEETLYEADAVVALLEASGEAPIFPSEEFEDFAVFAMSS